MNLKIGADCLDGGGIALTVVGEVDMYTAPELRERLAAAIEEGDGPLMVDLSGTTFVDSTALGVLVEASKRLSKRGGRLALVSDDPNVGKVFEITGLDRLFPVFRTRAEALDAAR